MNIDSLMQAIAVYAIPVLFAITIHEAAHGYVARHFGDPTAAMLGRVTLDPFKHVDPIGTIAMPLLLYFATAGAFLFGYAKPVPVNFANLRRPRRDSVLVALAGPASNFAQALLWGVVLTLMFAFEVDQPFFLSMAKAGVLVNLVMCAFNLFPLPPLDGGRIVAGLLPPRAAWTYSRIEPYGFFIVMALVIFRVVGDYWLNPLLSVGYFSINALLTPLRAVLS